MDAGRATIDAVMPDGQSCVVDAEQVQNGNLSMYNRMDNGTFATVAPTRNNRTVLYSGTIGVGSLLRASRGLTRLVNGRKSQERAGSRGESCHRRKPLPNRLQCGCAIERREGMAPALSGDECRSWAGHPVMVARVSPSPSDCASSPQSTGGPGMVIRAVDPAARPDALGFSESAPGR